MKNRHGGEFQNVVDLPVHFSNRTLVGGSSSRVLACEVVLGKRVIYSLGSIGRNSRNHLGYGAALCRSCAGLTVWVALPGDIDGVEGYWNGTTRENFELYCQRGL